MDVGPFLWTHKYTFNDRLNIFNDKLAKLPETYKY